MKPHIIFRGTLLKNWTILKDTTLLIGCLIVLSLFPAGCGTTSAPTESSTKTLDKTSNSTMDATSSTSPGNKGSEARAEQFTRENYARVKRDMAVGGGEYLAALGVLLDVPPTKEKDFFSLSREKYATLYPAPHTSASQMLALLHREMSIDPYFTHNR
jgi:hypothetical protein